MLVVIAGLDELDPVVEDEVDDAVFLGEPARPRSLQLVSQRLGPADSAEGLPHDRFDQIESSERDSSLGRNPIA